VYFTAGHPELNATASIIRSLEEAGADMVEIGIPFSDPMADGPVIQSSSSIALKNGMSLKLLFQQLRDLRKEVKIPLLLMGYLNPVLQYGFERFCSDCETIGIDGIILPDLPMDIFEGEFRSVFESHGLVNIFLVTPQTAEVRIRYIDKSSDAFIYMVSSSSTTGVKGSFGKEQIEYFRRIQEMNLDNPVLAGFGISNHESFETVCRYSHGAIIGSAFVKMLSESQNIRTDIKGFVSEIKQKTC